MSCKGPAIGVLINESGFVYSGHGALLLGQDDNHSVKIRQSTFVNTYLLHMKMREAWPTTPLSFDMERSIFGIVACCPALVELVLPQPFLSTYAAESSKALQKAFRQFKARDNVAQFWSWWASVRDGKRGRMVKEEVFSEFPQIDGTLRFGKRIEQIRFLIHKAHDKQKANQVIATVLPEDLIPTSTGVLAERMKAGQRYGCDVTKLPVPPPSTLQPYKIPNLPVPNKKK